MPIYIVELFFFIYIYTLKSEICDKLQIMYRDNLKGYHDFYTVEK